MTEASRGRTCQCSPIRAQSTASSRSWSALRGARSPPGPPSTPRARDLGLHGLLPHRGDRRLPACRGEGRGVGRIVARPAEAAVDGGIEGRHRQGGEDLHQVVAAGGLPRGFRILRRAEPFLEAPERGRKLRQEPAPLHAGCAAFTPTASPILPRYPGRQIRQLTPGNGPRWASAWIAWNLPFKPAIVLCGATWPPRNDHAWTRRHRRHDARIRNGTGCGQQARSARGFALAADELVMGRRSEQALPARVCSRTLPRSPGIGSKPRCGPIELCKALSCLQLNRRM